MKKPGFTELFLTGLIVTTAQAQCSAQDKKPKCLSHCVGGSECGTCTGPQPPTFDCVGTNRKVNCCASGNGCQWTDNDAASYCVWDGSNCSDPDPRESVIELQIEADRFNPQDVPHTANLDFQQKCTLGWYEYTMGGNYSGVICSNEDDTLIQIETGINSADFCKALCYDAYDVTKGGNCHAIAFYKNAAGDKTCEMHRYCKPKAMPCDGRSDAEAHVRRCIPTPVGTSVPFGEQTPGGEVTHVDCRSSIVRDAWDFVQACDALYCEAAGMNGTNENRIKFPTTATWERCRACWDDYCTRTDVKPLVDKVGFPFLYCRGAVRFQGKCSEDTGGYSRGIVEPQDYQMEAITKLVEANEAAIVALEADGVTLTDEVNIVHDSPSGKGGSVGGSGIQVKRNAEWVFLSEAARRRLGQLHRDEMTEVVLELTERADQLRDEVMEKL